MLNMKPRPSSASIFTPSTAGEIFLSNAAGVRSEQLFQARAGALQLFCNSLNSPMLKG